jgi:hypothetical protein
MNEDRLALVRGWTNVGALAFTPGIVVALAYDHGWGGPALRCVGSAIAIACALTASIWVAATDGKPGRTRPSAVQWGRRVQRDRRRRLHGDATAHSVRGPNEDHR